MVTAAQNSRSFRREMARWIEDRKDAVLADWFASQFDADRVRRYGIAGLDEKDPGALRRHFLAPLVDLLAAYAETGKAHYRDIYLDERLRYAPHQAPPPVRLAFFREVIPADEAAIIAQASPNTVLGQGLRALLSDLHAPLTREDSGHPLRLLAVGDCVMNEIRVFLSNRCREWGIELDMRCLYFSAPSGRDISAEQVIRFLETNPVDLIALSFLTYEGLPPYAALVCQADQLTAGELEQRVTSIVRVMQGFLSALRDRTDVPFLVHNASGLPLTRLRRRLPLVSALSPGRRRLLSAFNQAIQDLVQYTPNSLLVDEYAVASVNGHRACSRPVVPRGLSDAPFFHTSRFGEYLTAPYVGILRSYAELRKAKVLLVDFDDTLWDGVMADGPVHQRLERQALLRRVKDSGILLVALSKNDPASIRWSEMLLQPSDFVVQKISWSPKIQAIQEVATALDLGLDSFVLIDDNPIERDLVRTQLPAVRVLDASDAFTWESVERMLQFANTRDTEEARSRTELYRQQTQRREALGGAVDFASMMASLRLEVEFGRAHARDLDRIAELIQRTNQFNTTTIRYPRQELQRLLQSPTHRLYVASLADKCGRLGLVALAIIERRAEEAIFDSFVMSCRAMGFELERLMLHLVVQAEADAARYVGRFVATARNTPAMALFSTNGFRQHGDTEWVLQHDEPRPQAPAWFAVRKRG